MHFLTKSSQPVLPAALRELVSIEMILPVVSCLVIKDSTPVMAGGRGNRRAIQIKHDWKSSPSSWIDFG